MRTAETVEEPIEEFQAQEHLDLPYHIGRKEREPHQNTEGAVQSRRKLPHNVIIDPEIEVTKGEEEFHYHQTETRERLYVNAIEGESY